MFKSIVVLLVCNSLSLFATNSFQFIDLGHLSAAQNRFLEAALSSSSNHSEFNNAPEIGQFIQTLKNEYQIGVAIETGTYNGMTTLFLSSCFDEVHTIEIADVQYKIATETLKNCENVHCYLGSSEKVLHQILPSLKDQRVLFYLDAHWDQHWPLLDELEAIGKTHRDQCIIVIDDFKVPGRRDIPYDRYGSNECSFDYIKQKLQQVYTDYDYYYVIPKNVRSRAKFVAIPKNWSNESSGFCERLANIVYYPPAAKN